MAIGSFYGAVGQASQLTNLVNVLFPKKYTIQYENKPTQLTDGLQGPPAPGTVITAITFDLLLSENHRFENIVTTHPVENGSEISDHIYNKLRTGSLRGLVTNYTIKNYFFTVPLRIFKNLGNTTPQSLFEDVLSVENRAKSAYDTFKELWQKKTLFTVTTMFEVYKDVAITSVEANRDSELGSAQVFEVSFQQVKQVKLKKTEVDSSILPKTPEKKVTSATTDLQKQVKKKVTVGKTQTQRTDPLTSSITTYTPTYWSTK